MLGENETREIARDVIAASSCKCTPEQLLSMVSAIKNGIPVKDGAPDASLYDAYQARLATLFSRDLDDLLRDALEIPVEKKANVSLCAGG